MSNEISPQPDDATQSIDAAAMRQDPLIGQMAGNYHVLSRAGEGSFGCVYRARDIRLDRTVALKFLRGTPDESARQRFEQEARAMARLSRHPGIVDIHAWGEHEGRCYLAMEYLPDTAGNAHARNAEGLPAAEVIRIGVVCAEALQAAHGAGIVHGDVKPANILLDESGTPKLGDLGMAHIAGHDAPRGGSPRYMAPECHDRTPSAPSADLYSLGITLRTLLGSNSADAPSGLVEVIEHACAAEPDARPDSAASFAAALKAVGKERPAAVAATPRTTHPAFRWLSWAAIVVVALGIILFESLVPGGGGGSTVLADARLSLNRGEYEAARSSFESYLKEHPDHAEARYGLGYALLFEGDYAHAAEEFGALAEAAMREEGRAAVAYRESGQSARDAVEDAAQAQPNGYPAVLLGRLDLMDGQYESAKRHLESVDASSLRFDWQQREYLQTLGQLSFKEGDFEKAEQIFAKLEGSAAEAPGGFASDYAALARQQRERAQQEEVGQRLTRLKELMSEAPPAREQDTWTSRPLRIWIPPVEAERGLIARETGLSDVLPWRLSRALLEDADAGITPVERELAGQILAEQELSAALSAPGDAIQLGRVLGARLLLDAKVTRLFGEEHLTVALIDIETTRITPVGEFSVTRAMDADAWMIELVTAITDAAARAYPVRGRISVEEDGARLNIGSAVGVRPGMRFTLYADDNAQLALDGWMAEITQAGADASEAVLRGGDAAALVGKTLRAEAIGEESAHAP